jgi:hypothetical protein
MSYLVPPHGSRRAVLLHRALILSCGRQSSVLQARDVLSCRLPLRLTAPAARDCVFRGSMPRLRLPLSTLRRAPYGLPPRVTSSVRQPPPTLSLPSKTRVEKPCGAIRIAASPLGPAPTTTPSYSYLRRTFGNSHRMSAPSVSPRESELLMAEGKAWTKAKYGGHAELARQLA